MAKMSYDEVVKRLIELRISRGISQRSMARRLGLTPQGLSQIESGARNTGLDVLSRYSEELGLKLDLILSPPSGSVQVEVTVPVAELARAMMEMPPEMATQLADVVRALPQATPAFRAGVLSALRSMLPAAGSASA